MKVGKFHGSIFHFKWCTIEEKVEFHAFGDASERGYGSVVYLRIPNENGGCHVSFVVSKARVAPVKKVSLPRLELLAALITARLLVHVMKALGLSQAKHVCYSDSQVALCWIRSSSSRWKTYVANRVTEIQQLTNPSVWRHCPGVDNPADAASRGTFMKDLMSTSLWLQGPGWLTSGEFPDEIPVDNASMHYGGEEKKSAVSMPSVSVDCFDFSVYSSFPRLLNVIGWIRQFIFNS